MSNIENREDNPDTCKNEDQSNTIESLVEIESVFNKSNDPPYSYFCPESNGEVFWICRQDQDKNLLGVFYGPDNKKDRLITHFKSVREARNTRDVLINAGWRELALPKISLTTKTEDNKDRPLNRRERRALQKTQDKFLKDFKN